MKNTVRAKRRIQEGDLLATRGFRRTDFYYDLGDNEVSRVDNALWVGEFIFYVGPVERWTGGSFARVLTRLGLGWVERDNIEWLL